MLSLFLFLCSSVMKSALMVIRFGLNFKKPWRPSEIGLHSWFRLLA